MRPALSLATLSGQPAPGLVPPAADDDDVSVFGRRLDNARRAIEWLTRQHGIGILSLTLSRSGATVRVPGEPRLWRIFRDQCAWQQRRQVGALTVYTWFAVIFGTRIEWEETQCR